MSVDQVAATPSPDTAPPADTDPVEALLLAVASGNPAAFVALQSRMTGLVQLNIRRVLRDTLRSETVTQETFAEVLADAAGFDPLQHSAQTWLLTLAHQHAIDGLPAAAEDQGPLTSTSAPTTPP